MKGEQFIGLNEKEVKALLYLMKHKHGRSRDIEQETRLRQPEASIALAKLRQMGLIETKKEDRSGKGRPQYIYILKPTNTQIKKIIQNHFHQYVKEAREEINSIFGW
ncbi:MAG: hypothetical protein GWP09_01715 [Nitrospiraceae bacterium]|nr:hypothetical protein [Nitrospiraceae bacterium]